MRLSAKDMRPAGEGTYAVAGPLKSWLSQPMHGQVGLRENGLIRQGQARTSQEVREAGGLSFALGSRQMWFRTSDGTDPRVNGRVYEVVFPKLLPSRLVWWCWQVMIWVPVMWVGGALVAGLWTMASSWRPSHTPWLVERALVTALAAVFVTPGVLMLVLYLAGDRLPPLPWLRNTTLVGVTFPTVPVPLSGSTLASGKWQKQKAASFDAAFPGREALIRLTGETWYRVFRRTALDSTTIKVGLGDNLFEKGYIEEYVLSRPNPEVLEPMVVQIRRLQDACRARGVGFVFLITPSKAAVMPETIPPEWLRRRDPRPRGYELILPLLDRHGVDYVDGHAITCAAASPQVPPVFPRGGIHWDPGAALKTTQAIVERFRAQGVKVLPVEPLSQQTKQEPKPLSDETDLLTLMNLAVPWKYPVTDLTIKPHQTGPGAEVGTGLKKLTVVGGSFTAKICTQIQSSRQFKEIDHWSYFRLALVRHWTDGRIEMENPAPVMDVAAEVEGADCIILECNEQGLGQGNPGHVWQFLQATLGKMQQ